MSDIPTLTITGPANARSDRDGIRTYTWKGQECLSVTSAFKKAGIALPLHSWAISQVVARATGEAETLNAMLTRPRRPREHHATLDKKRREEAARWLRSAATEERDRRAAIGSAVHDAIAIGLAPDGIPDVLETEKDGTTQVIDGIEVRSRVVQFIDFMRHTRAAILAQEFQLFNLPAGYGGSGDLILAFPSGRRVLVDTKTGNTVLAEHVLQVNAYRGDEATFCGRDDVVDEAGTALLRSGLELGILHLDVDHWEYLHLREDPGAWPAFLGALRYARWLAGRPSVDACVASRSDNRKGTGSSASATPETAVAA